MFLFILVWIRFDYKETSDSVQMWAAINALETPE